MQITPVNNAETIPFNFKGDHAFVDVFTLQTNRRRYPLRCDDFTKR